MANRATLEKLHGTSQWRGYSSLKAMDMLDAKTEAFIVMKAMEDGWHINHFLAMANRHLWHDRPTTALWGMAAIVLANMVMNIKLEIGVEDDIAPAAPDDFLHHQRRVGSVTKATDSAWMTDIGSREAQAGATAWEQGSKSYESFMKTTRERDQVIAYFRKFYKDHKTRIDRVSAHAGGVPTWQTEFRLGEVATLPLIIISKRMLRDALERDLSLIHI